MMKNIIFLVFLVLLSFACEEQKVDVYRYGSLKGVVLDGEDYTGIEGVMVSSNPASTTVLTNSIGEFVLPKVVEGDVALTAHKTDYLSTSIGAAVYEDDTTRLTFFLLKDENDVGWVEIYDPVPGNGAVEQGVSFTMQWNVNQQYPSKELVYTVFYFESGSTTQKIAGENLSTKEVVVSNLQHGITYFWYVVAKYEGHSVANSPTWAFTTQSGSGV